MRPGTHREAAADQLGQLEARRARLAERVQSGQLGYAEGELAVRMLELDALIVIAHATLGQAAS